MTALKIIEYTWLVLAFITFTLGIYKSTTVGFIEGNGYWLFICTILSLLMYVFKRYQRLNYLKRNQESKISNHK